jgi:hypothetical protein
MSSSSRFIRPTWNVLGSNVANASTRWVMPVVSSWLGQTLSQGRRRMFLDVVSARHLKDIQTALMVRREHTKTDSRRHDVKHCRCICHMMERQRHRSYHRGKKNLLQLLRLHHDRRRQRYHRSQDGSSTRSKGSWSCRSRRTRHRALWHRSLRRTS